MSDSSSSESNEGEQHATLPITEGLRKEMLEEGGRMDSSFDDGVAEREMRGKGTSRQRKRNRRGRDTGGERKRQQLLNGLHEGLWGEEQGEVVGESPEEGKAAAIEDHSDVIPITMKNWISKSMLEANPMAHLVASSRLLVNLNSEEERTHAAGGAKRIPLPAGKNFRNMDQADVDTLFAPETEEEIQAIKEGTELRRQRNSIPMGPVSMWARFGQIQWRDLAAIDDGATCSFVSKGWLYEYLRRGGAVKVLSFDRKGHVTYDGSAFYTFGEIEVDVHLFSPSENVPAFKLRANVVKDSTAMYSVLLGTDFMASNRLFYVASTGRLYMAKDLSEQQLKVKSHRVEVNWDDSVAECYLDRDTVIAPKVQLRVVAVLQGLRGKKRKKLKQKHVESFTADTNASFGFIPCRRTDWSEIGCATSIVKPWQVDLRPVATEEGFEDEGSVRSDGSSVMSSSSAASDGGEPANYNSDFEDDLEDPFDNFSTDEREELLGEHWDDWHPFNSVSSVRAARLREFDEVATGGVRVQNAHVFKTPVQLVNTGDEAILLKAGTYLGKLCSAVEVEHEVEVKLGEASPDYASNYSEKELDKLLEDLRIESLDLPEEAKTSLRQLVAKYANVFAKTKTEIGHVSLMKVSIDVQGHPPIRVKPYRVSPAERNIIREEVEKMLAAGIIQPSTSAWASPVVLVPKQDGSIRFAIDFRKLNAVTHKEIYPIPHVQDYLDALQGNKYFTIADGQQAYFGLPMDENSRQYTAFICHMGQFEFLRLPFGLTSAPAIYQRLMNSVLHGMLWDECLVYLDDICVMSVTVESHLERLEHLFQRLASAGIKLKPSKCHLLQRSIRLLGHIVDGEGTRPVPDKVEAIKAMQIGSRSDLHTFLGMAGYYQNYCQDFAKISQPLRSILHSKTPFVLESAHETAIDTLKEILTSQPLLMHPNWDYEFELHCDASEYALGVVLCQVIDGVERVNGYYSRLLRAAERNYPITHKECLSVVWGIKKLRPYLYGRHFTVKTDHKALIWLLNIKDETGRLMRWAMLLQEYDFTILHRAGRLHGNADALSRLIDRSAVKSESTGSRVTTEDDVSLLAVVTRARNQARRQAKEQEERGTVAGNKDTQARSTTLSTSNISGASRASKTAAGQRGKSKEKRAHIVWDNDTFDNLYTALHQKFLHEQARDSAILNLRNALMRKKADLKVDGAMYRLREGLVYRVAVVDEGGKRVVRELLIVPATLTREVIRLHHDHPSAGHFGIKKTLHRLRLYYTWATIREDVVSYVESCTACQRNNRQEMPHGKLSPVIPQGPFDIIALDCLRLPDSVNGNTHVLVAIDHFTKYAMTFVLKGAPSARNILRCLVQILSTHSMVRDIRVDQGPEFSNSPFLEACEFFGIVPVFVPTEHHRANGLAERLIQTIQKSLCKVLDETVSYEYWEEYLSWCTFAYNTSFHEGIQTTPYFMVYGRHAVLPADSWVFYKSGHEQTPVDVEEYKSDMIVRFNETYARARIYLQKQYERIRSRLKHTKEVSFKIGEEVWVFLPEVTRRDVTRKLLYQWQGPFKILEKHPESEVLYRVWTQRPNKPDQWVHVNRIRQYVARESRPTDVILPVPTYDIDWEDLPAETRILEDLRTRTFADEFKEDGDVEPEHIIYQHPKRDPTSSELQLVGKVFISDKKRWRIHTVGYHPPKKVIMAWYELLREIRNGEWVGTGTSYCSTIPEVQYWISRSEPFLYPKASREGGRNQL